MKYFITGITGFLGKNLISELKKNGEETEIMGLTRNPQNYDFFNKFNIKIITGDLSDKNLLIKNLKNVNSVIHLAAEIRGKNRDLFYNTNVMGTQNLVDACIETKVNNIIFISSRLADPFYKNNIYGSTKFEAEKIIKNSGLNFVILRPTLIYGEYDNGDIYKLTKIIQRFPLIPVLGNGNYDLQLVYVKDVINAIIFILKNNLFNKKIYNLAGEPMSYNRIIDKISEQLNKKVIKIHIPLKLTKLLIGAYEKVFSSPSITVNQIESLINAKTMDTTEAKNDLKFNPVSFADNKILYATRKNKNNTDLRP